LDEDAILRELVRRQKESKCEFFVPNGVQEQFIRVVGGGKHFVNLLICANGVGKDCVTQNVLANIIWGPQNEWFRGLPVFERWPFPEKHIRVVTESQLVTESGPIDKEIATWWPKGRYTSHRGGKQYITHYKTDTGFLIDKMTYEQEPEEFEGVNLGMVVFSEPPPEDIYNRCVSRLRRGGMILIVMTPLTSAAWIQDRLLEHKDATVITGDIEANCREHGIRGNLNHLDIERMISQWTQEEIEARVHGRFAHLSNVIFGSAFTRKHHIIPDDVMPGPGSQWFHIVDPARGKPWAMAWGWVDPRGQITFDREYPLELWTNCRETTLAIRDYADLIKIMDGKNPMEWRIIDRHFANARNDYGTTLKRDLADKFGLEFQDSYSCEEEVETGIQKVKDLLRFNDRMPIDSVNFPRLRVKERCRNIIRGVERWDRDPQTLKARPDSVYKDHADLVRYAAMANLEIYVPRPSAPKGGGYVLGR
jgi:phage terminase large subunit-like protein